jgi:hypothetical protein
MKDHNQTGRILSLPNKVSRLTAPKGIKYSGQFLICIAGNKIELRPYKIPPYAVPGRISWIYKPDSPESVKYQASLM